MVAAWSNLDAVRPLAAEALLFSGYNLSPQNHKSIGSCNLHEITYHDSSTVLEVVCIELSLMKVRDVRKAEAEAGNFQRNFRMEASITALV